MSPSDVKQLFQTHRRSRVLCAEKKATEDIRGFISGNRIVSRTAFRQEVVTQSKHMYYVVSTKFFNAKRNLLPLGEI